jgi:transposase
MKPDGMRGATLFTLDCPGQAAQGKPAWLWVGATSLVTVFSLLATRSAEGIQRLLGEDFTGILGSDRWTAYNGFDPLRRQVCWAHLIRDFQALFERGGESQVIGKLLLKQTESMFSHWHRVRDGTEYHEVALSRTEFSALVQPIRREVKGLLQLGLPCSLHRVAAQSIHDAENLRQYPQTRACFVELC